MPRLLQIYCLVLVFSSIAWPQAQTAAVTFTLDFPTSQPEHYSIRVHSNGSSHYESSGRLSADSDETDSFDLDFRVSDETRQKIFDLAAKANYFQKDVDSHRKALASTGKKILGYQEEQHKRESPHNFLGKARVEGLKSPQATPSPSPELGPSPPIHPAL